MYFFLFLFANCQVAKERLAVVQKKGFPPMKEAKEDLGSVIK